MAGNKVELDSADGSKETTTAAIAHNLDDALFMLFFLQDGPFTGEEIQRTGYVLKSLRDVLTKNEGF
jgi:hypothetical protein